MVARALKGSLAVAAALLVVWSFARVLAREVGSRLQNDPRTELVVMHWAGDAGQEEDAIVEETLARFEAARPDVRVRRINPGDSMSFYTKLQTMMAAGEPPDVFYLGFERLAAFASAGLLEPLDAYLAEDSGRLADGEAVLEPVLLEDYYPTTVSAFRYDGERAGDGPLYGIPKDFTTLGFYYNRTLLRRAGLSDPPDDWTWDDFARYARTVGELDDATGAEFVTWPFVVRAYLMTEGADVAGESFDDITLREPATWNALDRLRSWRHDEPNTLTSGKSKVAEGSSVFLTGRVGMAGPFGRWIVPSYRSIPSEAEGGFDWDFAPMPRGAVDANVAVTVAWSVSSVSQHKREAWELVRFLVGPETQAAQAELGLAIPTLRDVAASEAFADPVKKPENDAAYLAEAEQAQLLRWPADPKFEDLLRTRLDQAIKTGDASLEEAVTAFEEAWADEGRSPLARAEFPRMPWRPVAWIGIALGGLALALLGWILLTPPRSSDRRAEERAGILFASPWLIGFALFMAFPIGLSLVLSLARWKGVSTLDQAEWVGAANYAQLLLHDDRFRTSLRVTLYYAVLAVPGGQLLALGAALLLNMKVRGMPFFRAAWYLPSVLAGVGISILWRWVFDSEAGLANAVLDPLLAPLGLRAPEWFGADASLFGPPAFALMSLWGVGGAMLVYLAGLQSIPRDLYEAAEIDAAGTWRRFRSVTLPMLSPVILFNGIMAIIGSFQVFTQAYVITGGEPGDKTRFYVLYLYNQAFEFYEMGYASAMAWILLLIVLALTVFVMRSSAKHVYYEGMK